jgi:hypothetical protein
VIIGSSATPASNATQWVIKRLTADGTGTLVTYKNVGGVAPNISPLDFAETATLCSVKVNYTIEPTYTEYGYEFDINQQNTWPWIPSDMQDMFWAPISAGIGIVLVTGPSNINFSVTVTYDE